MRESQTGSSGLRPLMSRWVEPNRLLRPGAFAERRWGWREAAIALVLFAGPGWAFYRGVNPPRATYPAEHMPYSYPPMLIPFIPLALLVVGFIWVCLLSDTRLRLPASAARVLSVVVFVQFVSFVLPGAYEFRHGSDNVEALEVGASAILHFNDPYLFTTHYGNPIAPLLGGLLLVTPLLALMHTLDLLNVIWLGGLAFLIDRRWGPWAAASMLIYFTQLPWTRLSLPLANDHAVAAAGVALFGSWGFYLATRDRPVHPLLRWFWACLFACALVYRLTMLVAVLPLAVLYIRRLGWQEARRWIVPSGLVSALLLLVPLVVHPRAYLEGPIRMNLAKGASDSVPYSSLYVLLATLVVLAVGAWFVRSLSSVWAVVAAALATMLLTVYGLRLFEMSPWEAFNRYETRWYPGWVFVFALASLLCPRTSRESAEPPAPAALSFSPSDDPQ